eukprot:COSAG01_NODE_1489_length_10133_cov_189.288120_5_plen_68_part_00
MCAWCSVRPHLRSMQVLPRPVQLNVSPVQCSLPPQQQPLQVSEAVLGTDSCVQFALRRLGQLPHMAC